MSEESNLNVDEELNDSVDTTETEDTPVVEETPVAEEVSEETSSEDKKESEITHIAVDNRKVKNPNWYNILLVALAVCFLFSCMQSVYIFALSRGRVGTMAYASKTDGKLDTGDTTEETNTTYEFVNDPHFTLEQAASVYDPNKETLTTMEIVDLVSPATVSVFITEVSSGAPLTVSSGSGFIISEEGYIVTNAHVVDSVLERENQAIYVKIPGFGDMIEASIMGTDDQTDIAVIKLNEEGQYPCVTLGDSDLLRVGEMVVAIGNSLGTLDGTVTTGIVSALDREITNNGYMMRLIQTDASINTGNSGGPLINSFGEVIGITNAKMSSAEGLGFAIPISSVRDIIESLITNGHVVGRPYLGIQVQEVASESYYGSIEGVYIVVIDEGGPADNGLFKIGDIIREIDGVVITQSSDIIDVRNAHSVGDELTFVVERDGELIEINLTIGDSSQ